MKLIRLVFLVFLICFCQQLFAEYIIPHTILYSDTLLTDSTKITNVTDSLKIPKNQAIKSKVKYNARDSILFDITKKMVYLYGAAEVTYEKIKLKAAFIRIDQANNVLYAEGMPDSAGKIIGKPVFEDDGQVFNSDAIAYNFKTKKGKISEVRTAEGEGFLIGTQVKKNEDDDFFVKNGKYTTCNLDHPHYYIGITKAKKTGKTIVSGPAYLVVEDVPLPLAIPFGFFPGKSGRSSGILLPEVGEDRALGFFLKNGGYYFGINDYLDLTLRGTIYSKGSFALNAANRYNVRYRFNGNLGLNYSERLFGEPETPGFQKQKDFFVQWSHNQDPKANPGHRFSANVNAGTSSYLKNNSSYNFNNYANNSLQSNISYNRMWKGTPFSLSTNLRHSQNTNTGTVSLSIPEVAFNMSRISPFDSKNRVGKQKWYQKIGLSYTLNTRNEIQTGDSVLFEPESLEKFRNGVQQSVPISTSFNVFKYFNVNPFFNYTERWYFSTVNKIWNGTSLITDTIRGFKTARDFNTGASLSTRFYGMYAINAAGVKALRHVVNPSLGFTYRPDYSKKEYGYFKSVQIDSTGRLQDYSIFETGIYGGPARGKSGLISLNIGNNLEMKIRSKKDTVTGTKKIKLLEAFNVSSAYNLAVDTLNLSNINITGRTTLFERLGIDFGSSYDPYVLQKNANGTFVRLNKYEWNENRRIGRLTSARLSFNTNLNAEAFKSKQPDNSIKYTPEELEYINQNPQAFVDFNIPWSLNVSYNLDYRKFGDMAETTRSLNFNGDLSVTPKWKVGFFSGYDFEVKKLTSTSLSIYRDLHCWDLSIQWIPFGALQSYNVNLKVKASILQDLKLSRRREYYER